LVTGNSRALYVTPPSARLPFHFPM